MRIKSRTFRAWMKANFNKGQLVDMVNHGVDGGWHGLTYYRETTALYNKFADEIWDALAEDAQSFGEPNTLAMLSKFGGAGVVETDESFKNLLVWYMAERIARELVGE